MTRLLIKLLFRNTSCAFLLIALITSELFLGINACFSSIREGDSAGVFNALTMNVIYAFVIFLVVSYGYLYEINASSTEDVSGKNYLLVNKQYRSLFPLLICALIVTALTIILSIIPPLVLEHLNMELLSEIVRCSILYLLCNLLTAILLAACISHIKHKAVGYALILCFIVLYSPIVSETAGSISLEGSGIYKMILPFIIFPEIYKSYNDFTLVPIEPSLISRIVFWIVLFASIKLLIDAYRRNARKRGFVLISISVTCLGMLLASMEIIGSFYCVNNTGEASDVMWYNQTHYMDKYEQEGAELISDLQIEKYELQIQLGRSMDVCAKLFLSEKVDKPVDLTLYHLYKIDTVYDDYGNILNYDREDDYLRIYPDSDIKTLNICYHGGGAVFYSSKESINLPGYFPYYPVTGSRHIFNGTSFCNSSNPYNSMYDVTISNSRHKVYSNLKETENGHFVGNTRYPSFIAGFLDEITINGDVTIIYPYCSFGQDPETRFVYAEYAQKVMDGLKNEGIHKLIFFPDCAGQALDIREGNTVFTKENWLGIYKIYSYNRDFVRTPYSVFQTFEEAERSFMTWYQDMKKYGDTFLDKDTIIDMYRSQFIGFYYRDKGTDEISEDELRVHLIKMIGESDTKHILDGE